MTGWLVGWSVSWLVCWSFFKILRFGEYVAIVYTLINTLLIIVLYRHGIKCAITKVKHIVELKDRVLAPWGPSSISAVAELVITRHFISTVFITGKTLYRIVFSENNNTTNQPNQQSWSLNND